MRSWLVIPAMAAISGGAAIALGMSPLMALLGAALAAAVRGLAGGGAAALLAAVVAPLLAVASLVDAEPRELIALAAAGWAVAELARPRGAVSPLVAVLPATVAAVLDPSFVALIAIAGVRLWAMPTRWVVVVPAVGCAAIGLAVAAGTVWPWLGDLWFAAPARPLALVALAVRAADVLGPLTAVAAIAGLAALARARLAELGLAAVVVGALLVDVRAGEIGAATVGLAALLAALAIGRLAALIRLPVGQMITGAVAGLLVLVPPAWTAVARAPGAVEVHDAHSGRASR